MCVCVCMPSQRQRLVRVSLRFLHTLYLSPFEPADSRSMTAHLSDLMPNVSSSLQGWRDGGQKKRSLGNKGEGTNGETKEEKRVYGGLENEERQ